MIFRKKKTTPPEDAGDVTYVQEPLDEQNASNQISQTDMPDPQEAEDRQAKKDKAEIALFLKRLIIFSAAMVIIFVFLFRIVVAPSDDMKPALRIGDLEIVYCLPSARRVGQVVYYEKDGTKRNGRIVAVPGDTVEVKNNSLYINGNVSTLATDYFETPAYEGDVTYPLTLKDGEYFILSDYRQGALDSRSFGPVSNKEIIGNVITIIRRSQI